MLAPNECQMKAPKTYFAMDHRGNAGAACSTEHVQDLIIGEFQCGIGHINLQGRQIAAN